MNEPHIESGREGGSVGNSDDETAGVVAVSLVSPSCTSPSAGASYLDFSKMFGKSDRPHVTECVEESVSVPPQQAGESC